MEKRLTDNQRFWLRLKHFFTGHKYWFATGSWCTTLIHEDEKKDGDYIINICECGKVQGILTFSKPRRFQAWTTHPDDHVDEEITIWGE